VSDELFIERHDYFALSEDEQTRYVLRFMASLGDVLDRDQGAAAKPDDVELKLDYVEHYFALMEWVLPAGEYDRLVRSRLWDEMWQNADLMRGIFERIVNDPNSTSEERDEARGRIEALAALVEHKNDIESLP
jgi:hypothetical protein